MVPPVARIRTSPLGCCAVSDALAPRKMRGEREREFILKRYAGAPTPSRRYNPAMPTPSATVREIISDLERRGTRHTIDGMARYGIVTSNDRIFGVSVADLREIAKKYGRDHDLAMALWASGWYEARMLTAFVDEPKKVTLAQMDRQARAFDNWAICDALCFHLYDKTPHAWTKIDTWATAKHEFVKRAAFATLAAVALHDKKAPDQPFL